MRFQQTDYTCGPASVVNCLLAIGVRFPEGIVAELAGTTEAGTDEHGIRRALRRLGYGCEELDTLDSTEAWDWLTEQLRGGRTAILSVENFSHWSSVVGLLGDERVIYVDPQDGLESNRRENGVRSLTRGGLTRVWGSRGRGRRRRYYAISIVSQTPEIQVRRRRR